MRQQYWMPFPSFRPYRQASPTLRQEQKRELTQMLTDVNEVSHLVSFDLVEWISLPGGTVELLCETKRYRTQDAISA
jgi:hypothetical protein